MPPHIDRIIKITSLLSALLLLAGTAAWAEEMSVTAEPAALTLERALAETYLKNPDLEAARAQLRAVDESHAQAMAGFKPTVNGTAGYTSTSRSLDTGTTSSNPKALELAVTQPLYSGGSTVADVNAASNTIKAARASLQVREQTVLLDAVTAYMNLIRDQEIVQLRLNNEKVLESHLKAAQERFDLGDITRTDVSQAQSRFAASTASRIAAEGNLKSSRAFFEKVIGLPPPRSAAVSDSGAFAPARLRKPAVKLPLPATEEEALLWAEQANPTIAYAKYAEEAATACTRSIMGENLPQVDLAGSVSKTYDPAASASDDETTRAVGITMTLPLYAGGGTMSRIRQSRQTENQLRMARESAGRALRQTVIDARERLAAAEAESLALQSQIDASKLALDGVKVEADYGSRTTLDLLDAEQEYLDAQVAHVSAETDRIIAAYGLLAAVGRLTASGLQLEVPVYNAEKNFQNLSRRPFISISE